MDNKGLEKLYEALAAFEDDDKGVEKTQLELAKESKDDFRSEWKRKTWEQFGGGVFVTPSGKYHLELNKDGSTKRLQRID